MKTYGGVDVQTHVLLTSALAAGVWSASCSGRFIPWVRTPDTLWVGGWVGSIDGLHDMEELKFLPHRDSTSDLLFVQPVVKNILTKSLFVILHYLFL
jgi:hypothetical protein